MTVVYTPQTELFQGLPIHEAPQEFVNPYTLVPHLLELYPDWSEEDVCHFLEEKTRRRIHPEERITVVAVFRRQSRSSRIPGANRPETPCSPESSSR